MTHAQADQLAMKLLGKNSRAVKRRDGLYVVRRWRPSIRLYPSSGNFTNNYRDLGGGASWEEALSNACKLTRGGLQLLPGTIALRSSR
jgi:hypothetical protein